MHSGDKIPTYTCTLCLFLYHPPYWHVVEFLTEVIFPLVQNTVGICKQITILVFYQTNYRWVAILNFFYALNKSNTFVLTVHFRLNNFVFQIFPFLLLNILLVWHFTLFRLSPFTWLRYWNLAASWNLIIWRNLF